MKQLLGAVALFCSALVWFASSASAQFTVTKTGDSVVNSQALTIDGSFGRSINGQSFQQDALVTHQGHQYIAYYDSKRQVCIARRKLPSDQWQVIRFQDYDFRSNDAHNTISIGICPKDGTIHLAFDHHNDPLHYRVSQQGVASEPRKTSWDTSLFGPIVSSLESGRKLNITYPRFWQTPEGRLQFGYRKGGSGNGDRWLADYDHQTGSWRNSRQIDSREGMFVDSVGKSALRCSYPNGYTYGPNGRLHTTWVWRESSQGSNHDLMYAYSDDQGETWCNNQGATLANCPRLNSPDLTVVRISRQLGLMNTHGQTVDHLGRVHVLMWHCTDESLSAAGSKPGEFRWGPPEARQYHHYWRGRNGDWHHTQLPGVAGRRPKIFVDKDDNTFAIFTRRPTDDHSDAGNLTLMAASSAAEWKDWKPIHVEVGPFGNEALFDYYRWKKDGVLSVLLQQAATRRARINAVARR